MSRNDPSLEFLEISATPDGFLEAILQGCCCWSGLSPSAYVAKKYDVVSPRFVRGASTIFPRPRAPQPSMATSGRDSGEFLRGFKNIVSGYLTFRTAGEACIDLSKAFFPARSVAGQKMSFGFS